MSLQVEQAWPFTVVLLGRYVFAGVSRHEDNVETDKSSCILIDTFLLKLSSQWVEYALACVHIDLPIGEMKKKAKTGPNSDDCSRLFYNLKLYFYQEKFSF